MDRLTTFGICQRISQPPVLDVVATPQDANSFVAFGLQFFYRGPAGHQAPDVTVGGRVIPPPWWAVRHSSSPSFICWRRRDTVGLVSAEAAKILTWVRKLHYLPEQRLWSLAIARHVASAVSAGRGFG